MVWRDIWKIECSCYLLETPNIHRAFLFAAFTWDSLFNEKKHHYPNFRKSFIKDGFLTHLCKAHADLYHVLGISIIIWLLLDQCKNPPGEKSQRLDNLGGHSSPKIGSDVHPNALGSIRNHSTKAAQGTSNSSGRHSSGSQVACGCSSHPSGRWE